MREPQGQLVKRLDYQPSAYFIDHVELTFDLEVNKTRVLNRMRVRRNSAVPPQALRLDGEELNLARVLVNGEGTSDRKSTRLNSSHVSESRMPSSA